VVRRTRGDGAVRRQRQRTEETRRALLSAARSLFREQGYAATTVADITRRAERGHGTFYLYFDNKQDVFAALLAGMGDAIKGQARTLWRHESPVFAVWLGVRNFFEVVTADQDLWHLLEEMAAVDQTARALRARMRASFVHHVRRGLEESPHLAATDLDLDLVADLLMAMVFRFARLGHLPAPPDVLACYVSVVWARGLGYPSNDLDALRQQVLDH